MAGDILFHNGEAYVKATMPSNSTPGYQIDTAANPDVYTGQSTAAGSGGETIVPKLADEIIPIIRQQSYCRQFLRVVDMPAPTFNMPKFNQGSEVFYVAEGFPTPFTKMGGETIQLVAKKFMTSLTLSSELTEDNIIPILPYIKRDIAKAFALAEEEAFLYGKTDPTTAVTGSVWWSGTIRNGGARANTVIDSTKATESNWFQGDKRLAFNGVSVLSEPNFSTGGSDTAATKVDAGGGPLSIDDINQGIQYLDVFGRAKDQLLLVVSLREEKALRQDPMVLTTLERFGPSAVFLTGEIGKVYGVSVVATNLIPITMGTTYDNLYTSSGGTTADAVVTADTKSEAFLFNRNAFIIGDRRMFSLKASDIPYMMADQLLLVATERIGFTHQFRKAAVKIENIKE